MPETHGLTLKEIGGIYAEEGKEPMVGSSKLFDFISFTRIFTSLNSNDAYLSFDYLILSFQTV